MQETLMHRSCTEIIHGLSRDGSSWRRAFGPALPMQWVAES